MARSSVKALIVASMLAVGVNSVQAAPPKYRITPIDVPQSWDGATVPQMINNSGTVMGRLLSEDIDHVFRFRESEGTIDIQPNMGLYVWGYGMNRQGDISAADDQGGAFVFFANNQRTYLSSGDYHLSDAVAINGQKQVIGAGYSGDDTNGYTFFTYVWKNGVTTILPDDGYSYVNVIAINNAGVIVGNGNVPEGGPHPFVYKDGVITELESLGTGDNDYVNDISGVGDIIGTYQAPHSGQHGYIYKNGQMTDLGTFGGESSSPKDLNNSGHVVGSADRADEQWRAFYYDGTSLQDITPVGGTYGRANDITENGQACGLYYLGDSSRRAFIYGVDGPRSINLNTLIDTADPSKPYVVLTDAVGVNERGQIVAAGGDSRNPRRTSFLLSPVDSTPPTIASKLTGTKGLSGWFTSPVVVSWTTTDPQAPVATKNGCDSSSVFTDTKSQQFTCSASSIGGSATKTVTVKRDATAPTVTTTQPSSGAVFNRNQVVKAKFACTDTTAGIKTCVGTVGNGVKIDTSKKVTNAKFTVTATDKGGLQRVLTTTFSVK